MEHILKIIQEYGKSVFSNQGISFVTVSDETEGITLAKNILSEIVSTKSALYLSGGRTPKELYVDLAKEEKIDPGVVGLVDERYGKPFHENSNELMLRETGLLRYFQMRDIPFFQILKDKTRENETELYDQKLREIFATYQKQFAVLGIGMDGHTAGIPADPSVWQEYHLQGRSKTEMVIDYDDHGKFYNQRISMSFLALSMMDVLLVLVFGKDKKRPLEWMMADGPEDEVPSRFFKRSDIAVKTLLITDQHI